MTSSYVTWQLVQEMQKIEVESEVVLGMWLDNQAADLNLSVCDIVKMDRSIKGVLLD